MFVSSSTKRNSVECLTALRRVPSSSLNAVFLILGLIAWMMAASTPVWAAEWVVKRATGKVYLVAPGIEAFRAKPGMVLQPGMTVATKDRAKALIARGEETIFVGPNTKVALSKYRSSEVKTTLLQTSGLVEVDVKKRAQPHFTVETPYMAAVVKGTKFTVKVGSSTARVTVERGLVQVDDFASGDRANVGAGQSASTNPSRNVGLQVAGATKPQVVRGEPKAPVFQTPPVANVPQAIPGTSRQRGNSANRNGGVLESLFGGTQQTKKSNNGRASANSNAGGNGNGNGGGNGNGQGNGKK